MAYKASGVGHKSNGRQLLDFKRTKFGKEWDKNMVSATVKRLSQYTSFNMVV